MPSPHRSLSLVSGVDPIPAGLEEIPHGAAYRQEALSLRAPNHAYVESFNRRCGDECLNEHWFRSVAEAQTIIEGWRID